MTDNIKLPAPKFLYFEEIGELHEPGDYVPSDCTALYTAAQVREAVRLNAQAVSDEPDWRHPKVQGLIGSEARLRIAIDLIWQILEDPNQEFTASDMEYWDTIHDDLKAALSAAPAAPQPARKPLTPEQVCTEMARLEPKHNVYTMSFLAGVRFAERMHGIGEKMP